MMRPATTALAIALVSIVLVTSVAADDSDRSHADVAGAPLGERFTVTLELTALPGARVDVDTLAPSWNGVDVIAVEAADPVPVPGGELHVLTLTVAAFLPGEVTVIPAVLITDDGIVEQRELPPFDLSVPTTLSPNAPLELRGGIEPRPVGGAQSPLLIPLVIVAIAGASAAVLWVIWRIIAHIARRTRRKRAPSPKPADAPRLPSPGLVLTDPVPAYRSIAAIVRNAIGNQYGFPARALTTAELADRMQAEGVDRWQARLVTGLLENCDAVVYAGHRPSEVRRRADLTMAEEILEAFA